MGQPEAVGPATRRAVTRSVSLALWCRSTSILRWTRPTLIAIVTVIFGPRQARIKSGALASLR